MLLRGLNAATVRGKLQKGGAVCKHPPHRIEIPMIDGVLGPLTKCPAPTGNSIADHCPGPSPAPY